MVKFQRILEKAKIMLNSDDAIKTVDTSINATIPVADQAVVFDSSSGTVISTATSTITFNDHGFANGEAVVYTAGTTAIGGLATGNSYFIIRRSEHVFSLASSDVNAAAGTAITLTSVGAGTHNFKREANFDGSAAAAVDVPTSRIFIAAHGLANLNYVQYTTTGTVITGLTNNAFYYVKKINNDIIRLFDSPENYASNDFIDFTALGTGATHTIRKTINVDTTGSSVIDLNREFFNIPGHGFTTGDLVQYKIDAGNTAIAPLLDNSYYYVIVRDIDTFSLTLSENTSGATAINITAFGTGNHTFQKLSVNTSVITNFKFKIDNQFILNDKCKLALVSFDYIENFDATLCKSVGGVYIKTFQPNDIFNSQGNSKGTLLYNAYFGTNISYQNNNIEYTSLQLPHNTSALLQNGLDIFIDTKKRNDNNEDINGFMFEDRFSMTLLIYEVDEYEYINLDLNDKVKNMKNPRHII